MKIILPTSERRTAVCVEQAHTFPAFWTKVYSGYRFLFYFCQLIDFMFDKYGIALLSSLFNILDRKMLVFLMWMAVVLYVIQNCLKFPCFASIVSVAISLH